MKRKTVEAVEGYLFVLPVVLGILIFTAWPVIQSLYYSFSKYNIIKPPVWVGLNNYKDLFTNPDFWHSLKVTAIFAVINIPLGLLSGFLLAVLLLRQVAGVNIFRTIFYLPMVVPVVAMGVLWKNLLSVDYGFANAFLNSIGLPSYTWFSAPETVMPTLILMGLWQCGSAMIIWLSGLQGVPIQLYEAAIIDGAGAIKRFFFITIPMVTPVIFFNLIMGLIGAIQVFGQVQVTTGGGPLKASNFLMVELYQKAFGSLEMGYASALAWIIFIIIMILTMVVFRTSQYWVYYEGENN